MQNPLSVITTYKGKNVHMVPKAATVAEAAEQMFENKVDALLVGEGDNIEGIFSERDVVTRVVFKGLDPKETPVSDVMTKDPHTVSPKTTIDEAMQVVTERHIRHLPLVDNGKLAGMISSGDLTAWVASAQAEEVGTLKTQLDAVAARNQGLIYAMIGLIVVVVIGIIVN